jgi:cytochrome P450 family 110
VTAVARTHAPETMALPPGPRDARDNAHRMFDDPAGFYRACRDRYRDPFTVATPLGRIVFTARPDAVADLFAAPADTFGVFARQTQSPFLGDRSIFLLSGPEHAAERRLMGRLFAAHATRARGTEMLAIAHRHLSRIVPGQEIEFLAVSHAISLEIIVRLAFGVSGPQRIAQVSAATEAFLRAIDPSVMYDPAQRHTANPVWTRFLSGRAALDALIAEEIAARRATPLPGSDMLSALLDAARSEGVAMPDKAIRDELVTLLLAGHETTAISTAWAVHWLGRHPAVLARLRDELAGSGAAWPPDALLRLEWLDAVCNETMRLFPIGTEVPRLLVRPLVLAGYRLPPGTVAAAATALLHLDPALYPAPDSFRPERFLERRFALHEFIPFGGGHRRCLGAAFGALEMKLVLAAFAGSYQFELAHPGPMRAVRRNLTRTLGPEDGVRLRVLGPA